MKGAWRTILNACLLFLAITVCVNAGPILIIGGSAGTVPEGGSNAYIPGLFPGPQIPGYYGAQIQIGSEVPVSITADYFGAEAGWVNRVFVQDGDESPTVLFTHTGGMLISPSLALPLATVIYILTDPFEPEIPPFGFSVNNWADSVMNGENPDDLEGNIIGPNFFASCDPFGDSEGSSRTCSSVYIFLDDGGNVHDDNHDDMLVRITVSEIPEPSTWLLLGAGLIGFGVVGRRR
jgi:hypothetical protein